MYARYETDFSREGFTGNFLIMQSNGGTMSAEAAEAKPVSIMESGPVAGVIGCGDVGRGPWFARCNLL